jgi:hypothetical protein
MSGFREIEEHRMSGNEDREKAIFVQFLKEIFSEAEAELRKLIDELADEIRDVKNRLTVLERDRAKE